MSETKPIKTVGKRGKDILPRKKRNDSSVNTAIPDDIRQKIICHDMMVRRLGKLNNPNDPIEVNNRVEAYLTLCMQNVVSPTVDSMDMDGAEDGSY